MKGKINMKKQHEETLEEAIERHLKDMFTPDPAFTKKHGKNYTLQDIFDSLPDEIEVKIKK